MSHCAAYGKQKGIALVLVLWVALLMTVIAGGFALSARTESVQSRILFNQVQAEFLAEAGLNRAVFELRNPDPETRWIADGRAYEFTLNEAKISVQITDESGKIDLNLANEELLVGLFASVGVEFDQALALSDKIQDWRDPDEEVRLAGAEDADYFAAGYAHGAKDAPFDSVPEVLQVMGMSYELYRKIEPAITVYSGRGNLNLAFAPKEALMALDGINAQMAEDYINQRHDIFDMSSELPVLIEGQSGSLRSGSTTFSVVVKATLPNNQWTELDTTIRLGGNVRGRPFQIIRWRDNKNK